MQKIAGRLTLDTVMRHLSTRRPVFHSEADFQFAFAQTVADLDPAIQIRLEVRQPGNRSEYVDLACTAESRTLIEFKYATAGWAGHDGVTEEQFTLRHHSAMDLARKHFIHDVTRLERFIADPSTNGLAVLLTNDSTLWTPPVRSSPRDLNFRIHEGRTLTGTLIWGTGDHPSGDRTLHGTYTAQWQDYSHLPGGRGHFRWLGWYVAPAQRPQDSDRAAATTPTRPDPTGS